MLHTLTVSCQTPFPYPVKLLLIGLFDTEGKGIETVIENQCTKVWGERSSFDIVSSRKYPFPVRLVAMWVSAAEQCCYRADFSIDTQRAEAIINEHKCLTSELRMEYLPIGIAPFGGVAVWLSSYEESLLLNWEKAIQISQNNQIGRDRVVTICQELFSTYYEAQSSLANNGLPSQNLFERRMTKYDYRFVALEEYYDGQDWRAYSDEDLYYDDLDLDSIYVLRLDGTLDKRAGFELLNYHHAGVPSRISVKWHSGKAQYSAYFWLELLGSMRMFERFFIIDSLRPADLLLRLDSRAQRYELALSRAGEQTISSFNDEAYQAIVFRDGREFYRTPNYNQPDGAWVW